MPDVVIVGSVALDNVRTPFGKAENALGGSATYASVAASYFAKPGIDKTVCPIHIGNHVGSTYCRCTKTL